MCLCSLSPAVFYKNKKLGGTWRFGTPGVNRITGAFHGYFHLVLLNECIIQTFEYEGLPEFGHVALERAEFKKLEKNKTEIKITTTFQSVEDRDNMLSANMEEGYRESINALGRLIE